MFSWQASIFAGSIEREPSALPLTRRRTPRPARFPAPHGAIRRIMKYRHFDDSAREYVIGNPKTPVKWINYVGSLRFGGFVDHTGGLLLCKGDPALNRITKYIPQLPSSQLKGQTLYLRKREGRSEEHTSELQSPYV